MEAQEERRVEEEEEKEMREAVVVRGIQQTGRELAI